MEQVTTPEAAIALAERHLAAMEARDLAAAEATMRVPAEITFPGGRRFARLAEVVANSGGRYSEIRKAIERRDGWATETGFAVLITGTLYGAWPDGRAFSGIRFADRFDIEDGLIVRQDVWNDSGETILEARA